jgi:hypothetical protein
MDGRHKEGNSIQDVFRVMDGEKGSRLSVILCLHGTLAMRDYVRG